MRKILFLFAFLGASTLSAQDSIPKKLVQNLEFRAIGPAGMSGRITAIQVDPRDKNHIYVGSASGGMWQSTNGGTSWDCLFNNETVSSVGALALDPQNPDVIWLGTGEGNPRNSNTGGAGLYKSIDGGKSWKMVGLEKTRHIHRVIVNPFNPDIVYVAAIGNPWADSEHRGVYKTTDGGKNWERILYRNARTGAAEMVMDPQNPDKLIVNMWEHRRNPWFFKSGGPGSGLFISYDGGTTWKEKKEDSGLPKGELGRMGIAIAASQPSRVYAFIEKKGKNALYRSENGGENWQKISEDENIGNRPFYYAEIYVDPHNENRVYSIWSVISRSEDGGKNWEVIAPYNYIHPDHHALFIHPEDPTYIINGNDGGLNISRDKAKTWRFVSNLPIAQFYHINYDMETPYNVYGGMQDNGSWKGPAYVWRADGIRNDYWEELFFGDGFDVSPDPSDNRFVYAMSQEGNVGRIDTETGYYKMIKPVHPENETLRFNWNAPIAQDPFDDKTIYYGAQYVFKSQNQGQSWELISPDLTTNDTTKQNYGESGGLTYDVTGAENYTTLLCIEPSGLEQNLLWVSSDDGKLHLSKDGGANWTDISKALKDMPQGAWIPQIVHSQHKKGAAFVVANDYRRGNEKAMLYYTEDYGQSFKNIGGSLPAYVISTVQDPKDENLIFAGTQRGLYFSWDKGAHWQKWGKDLPTVLVSDMKIHPREDDLILGTFGRSAYILDDLETLRALVKAKRENSLKDFHFFAPRDIYKVARKRADGSRFPADGIFKGENRSTSLQAFVYNGYEASDSIKDKNIKFEIIDAQGDVVRSLYRDAKEGMQAYSIYMSAKGIGFPSKNRSLKDTNEIAPLDLVTGNYRIMASFNGLSQEYSFNYQPDPRLSIASADEAKNIAYQKELDQSLANLHVYTDWLKSAQTKLKIAQSIAEFQLDTDQAKAFNDSLKPLQQGLKKLEERVYGREVDGYYDQPKTLQSQYYAVLGYVGSGWDGVPSQAEILKKGYQKSETEFIKDLQAFQQKEWLKFAALREQFNLQLQD
tara:strand:+ start:1084 stop:4185 length:3102 start_codon:yes stop_codon:yes gene_type:complete